MNAEQIAKIVATGESEVLEFKGTTGTRREAARTVCAMLNQQGGQVLFGVSPEGRVIGQQVGERTIEEVGAELMLIDPPAFPAVERIRVREGLEVITISVGRGRSGPYMYRGKAYRRVGNSTIEMRAEEYGRMLFERIHNELRWENQPASGWSVDELDANEVRTAVEEAVRRGRLEDPGTRDPVELLRGLGLHRNGVLLRAAVVLFGKEAGIWPDMPQCLLRVARFKGIDRTEFLDNRQFHGNAFYLLRAAERFLRDGLPIAGRVEEDRFKRIDEPLYPPLAMREALANALCHRDYSVGGGSVGVAIYDDRLEITSTGSLHFELTPEKLFEPHESIPWNPLIAEVFYRRGIIERWGRGTLKMIEETIAAGLPQPEIRDAGGCVTVVFRQPEVNPLNDQQRQILGLLQQDGRPIPFREIVLRQRTSMSERQVKRVLIQLKGRGVATVSGRGVSARWRRSSKQ